MNAALTRDQTSTTPTGAVLASISEIPAYIHEIMSHFPVDLPEPNVQVVNRSGVRWLGRTTWVPGEPNTTIFIQKAVTGDAESLKRVLAHELVHHLEYLTKWLPLARSRNLNQLMSIEGAHGRFFQTWATRLNSVYGADFVSETSDANIVEEEARAFYVLLKKKLDGMITVAYAVIPSQRQKDYINSVLTTGTVPGAQTLPGEYKLIRSRDRLLSLVVPIGKGFSRFQDPEVNTKLQDLWDHAPTISKVAVQFDPLTPRQPWP